MEEFKHIDIQEKQRKIHQYLGINDNALYAHHGNNEVLSVLPKNTNPNYIQQLKQFIESTHGLNDDFLRLYKTEKIAGLDGNEYINYLFELIYDLFDDVLDAKGQQAIVDVTKGVKRRNMELV